MNKCKTILSYINNNIIKQQYKAKIINIHLKSLNNLIHINSFKNELNKIYELCNNCIDFPQISSKKEDFNIESLQLDTVSWEDINQSIENKIVKDINNSQIKNDSLINRQTKNEPINNLRINIEDKSSKINEILNNDNLPVINLPKYIDKAFNCRTPYIHRYQSDITNNNHNGFISDFFPINNEEIITLIKSVRETLMSGKHTSIIDIYKYWVNSLKENNENYYIYNFNNFNDLGEYLGNISDSDTFDLYLSHMEDVITYDEAEALRLKAKKNQEEAEIILKSGTYHSDIDPDLTNYFKEK